MKSPLLGRARDFALLAITACFLSGCLAGAHRGPRTLGAGQLSLGAGYTHAFDDDVDDAMRLLHLDGRIGVGGGAEVGLAHASDFTEDSDGAFSTLWGDVRLQLSNRANRVGVPVFTLGLAKGYVYDEDLEVHITSLPLQLGVPVHERVTPWLLYRPDFLSVDFLPDGDSFEDPVHTMMIGSEFRLAGREAAVVPKLGIGIGWIGSEVGDTDLTMIQVGLTVETRRGE